MSDFDKEAEREKLREKYGEEEEKREATEQMSELLLKGATMTNAHCTDCGDPIFRYDGQEFCPTCQKPVARQQPEADETDTADEADDDHIEVADPSDDATVQFGATEDEATEQANGDAVADSSGAPPETDQSTSPPDAAESTDQPPAATQQVPSADPGRSPAAESGGSPATDAGREGPRSPDTGREAPVEGQHEPRNGGPRGAGNGVSSELSAAESLLAETVHRFAQRAADSEDPRTAREHLSAAREAAEALDAVRF